MKSRRAHSTLPPVSAPSRSARPRRSESLAGRTLVAVARQRKGLDPTRCQLVLEHLDAALAVQTALHRTLAVDRLADLPFAVLVALFALDPEPLTPADLADYTAGTRTAITDALVRLEALQLVSRQRHADDRRVSHVHLTARGRTTVDRALMRYLTAAGQVARHLDLSAQDELFAACQRLQRGAAELTSEPSPS